MKSILMSIKPKYVAKILNGKKKREIRSKFPADYVGWVYIYCTKGKPYCMVGINNKKTYCDKGGKDSIYSPNHNYIGNGKVVARFWCDKVEEYINGGNWTRCEQDNGVLDLADYLNDDVLGKSCLAEDELFAYCGDLTFSAIHITNLDIFDKPKEISEFKHITHYRRYGSFRVDIEEQIVPLTKAPQSWQYIEVE